MNRVYQRVLITATAASFAASVLAQSPVTPANPGGFTQRGLSGGSSSGVGIVARQPAVKQTVTVEFIAVTSLRIWTNREGKAIEARLLAYPAAENAEKRGKAEVIRDGKVRFLLAKSSKPVDYAIDQLSESDRTYVHKLADAVRHEEPSETRTITEKVE